MIDKPRRAIDDIASELQSALKRETADLIAIGDLLLEAKEQVEHGEWRSWLAANFGQSVRTAERYMNAARFAAKNVTVTHLKLRSSALYVLGSENIELDEINAVLKAAETAWIDYEGAIEIINSLHAARLDDTPEASEAARAAEAARTEADEILEGSPPELPPLPEPAPVNGPLQEFDRAVATLLRLDTKPRASFVDTTHGLEVINTVHKFMEEVAGLLKK